MCSHLAEDGIIKPARMQEAFNNPAIVVAFVKPRRDNGYHYVDHIAREAKSLGNENLTAKTYTVHSTISPTCNVRPKPPFRWSRALRAEYGPRDIQGAETNIANVRRWHAD
jgi:hypothetical protein